MDLKVAMPEEGALVAPATAKLELVQSMQIDSADMYQEAGLELQAIKRRAKELDAQRDGLVRPLNETVAKINALFKRPLSILGQAEAAIKGAMLTYQREEQEKAEAARRQAEEAARKERERLAQIAAAAQAKADAEAAELRRKAEEAAAAGKAAQAAKLASKAESREEAGAERVAELAMQQAAVSSAALPALAPVRAAGTATRTVWKAECTNKADLIAHIAGNPQFLHLASIEQSALNQLAKATRGEMKMPGVRFYPDQQLAARSA